MMATDRSSDRDRDAPTDQPVATVDATRIPRHCSAPECAETPEWAWRTDDGHLQYDRIGHLLVPCLCDEHKEEVDR